MRGDSQKEIKITEEPVMSHDMLLPLLSLMTWAFLLRVVHQKGIKKESIKKEPDWQ